MAGATEPREAWRRADARSPEGYGRPAPAAVAPEDGDLPLPPHWRDQLSPRRTGTATAAPRPGRRGLPRRLSSADGRRRSVWGRRVRRVLAAVLGLVVVAAAGFGLLLAFTPSISDAPARVARIAAAAHAPLLAGALPSRVVAALVATEDSRFYSHHGVDPLGAIRGSVGPLVGSGDQGGATLDQQLSKIVYTNGQRSFTDRVEQVALAVKLDAHFSKPDILRMYLDAAYFGHGYQGITEASEGYFGRAPTAVTWAQAAMLAGLVQAPTAYDPKEHLAAATTRQRLVLGRLVATGRLTRAAANAAASAPLGLES